MEVIEMGTQPFIESMAQTVASETIVRVKGSSSSSSWLIWLIVFIIIFAIIFFYLSDKQSDNDVVESKIHTIKQQGTSLAYSKE